MSKVAPEIILFRQSVDAFRTVHLLALAKNL